MSLHPKELEKIGNDLDKILDDVDLEICGLIKDEENEGFYDRLSLEEEVDLATFSIGGNPAKRLYSLVLLQAVTDKATGLYFGYKDDCAIMHYTIDEVKYEMIPPPNHIMEVLGEEVGVFFGLIKEQEKKRGLIDKLIGIGPEIERIISPEALSTINPVVHAILKDQKVDLRWMRGDYDNETAYHIAIEYVNDKIE